jgi:ABC-type nickel/cobalt efflux system permease component RcnA
VTLAQNVMNTGIFIAIFLSAMIFAYAGWLYLSNQAIGEQQRAKKMFANVAFGLVIILAAWLVVDTLMRTLLKDSVTWSNICSQIMN